MARIKSYTQMVGLMKKTKKAKKSLLSATWFERLLVSGDAFLLYAHYHSRECSLAGVAVAHMMQDTACMREREQKLVPEGWTWHLDTALAFSLQKTTIFLIVFKIECTTRPLLSSAAL